MPRWLKWLINLMIGLPLAAFILYIATFSPSIDLLNQPLRVPDRIQPAHVVVALSSSILKDCKPHPNLLDRERYAVALWKQGFSTSGKVVFTGHYVDEAKQPLAQCRQYLAQQTGIPETALILDNQAFTTVDNVRNTKALMRQHQWKTVLLVTSKSHMKRALLTFKKQGLHPHPASVVEPSSVTKGTFNFYRVTYLHRLLYEYGALLKYAWYGYI